MPVEQNWSSYTFLIVDDHSVIRRTLSEWLREEYPELKVLEASSAEEALQLLHIGDSPDLVVMDFHLPGRSGIRASSEIKRRYPELPVVMLTIQEDDHYQKQALQAGVDEYIVKRRMYTDLLPAIKNLLISRNGQNKDVV